MDRLQESSPTPPTRKPWLAFLMSLVFPGLGQVYNGHAARGLIWYLAIAAYGFGFMHWHSPWISLGVRGFIFAWSLVLLGHLLAGIEAAVSARRSPKRRPYQKWWCYLYCMWNLCIQGFMRGIRSQVIVPLLKNSIVVNHELLRGT